VLVTIRAARRALAAHPRAVLAVLLAFAIQILPLSAGIVSHRHAGGGASHAHVGRIAGGAPRVGAASVEVSRVGIEHAPARDLHHHVVQPTLVGGDAGGVTRDPTIIVGAVAPRVPALHVSASSRPGHARAPPAPAV
jgi:hypothetical protein